jgi:glycosyltransferase involved in cell wall biosynthesis
MSAVPRVSICIPTYNRARHLANCLHSLATCGSSAGVDFEICISDNGSTDDTAAVVEAAQREMPISYRRNPQNLGIPRNFLAVVDMAKGEFAWLVGDDDLVMPGAIVTLLGLIERHPKVDFFYVNSHHLQTEYVRSFPQPFDMANLPRDMARFSDYREEGERPFFALIDPRVSFDFLGGMFLVVFRRSHWQRNVQALDPAAILDMRTFSHFDNTFPHVKIFSRAFARSTAYFHAAPLSVCLTGAREWAPMYPLIHSVRLVEALREYRRNGMPFTRYLRCRNFALNNFLPDLAAMFVHRARSGFAYLRPAHVLSNLLYPNVYWSLPRFLARKLRRTFLLLTARRAS